MGVHQNGAFAFEKLESCSDEILSFCYSDFQGTSQRQYKSGSWIFQVNYPDQCIFIIVHTYLYRHLFFWMLEKDPASWQDETLGDKLTAFFKTFLSKLEKKELPNYFIKKQNLLLKLPKHKVGEAHAKVFILNENIVPHLIHAVKNLRYTAADRSFYPALDCHRLIEIISTDNSLHLVIPRSLTTSARKLSVDSQRSRYIVNKLFVNCCQQTFV